MKNVKTFSALMLMVMFTLAISITSSKKNDDGPTPDPMAPDILHPGIDCIGHRTSV
jgi:hypothetical protein